MALAAILPLWVLVAGSVTGEQELILEGYSLMPKTFSLDAYKYLFIKTQRSSRAYGITVFITVVGTAASLLLHRFWLIRSQKKTLKQEISFPFLYFLQCCLMEVSFRRTLCGLRIFHLKNTITALILPGLLMNGFNVILMKNYFRLWNIPAAEAY